MNLCEVRTSLTSFFIVSVDWFTSKLQTKSLEVTYTRSRCFNTASIINDYFGFMYFLTDSELFKCYKNFDGAVRISQKRPVTSVNSLNWSFFLRIFEWNLEDFKVDFSVLKCLAVIVNPSLSDESTDFLILSDPFLPKWLLGEKWSWLFGVPGE